jgi:hypothetical protein
MSVYLSAKLRRQLIEADDHRCAYCQTLQANSGYPMVAEHIYPRSKGGITTFDNLCFACHRCNEFKSSTVAAEDPLTGESISLFHPRQQNWSEHFAWSETGTHIIGLTGVGRVTVITLKMNNKEIVDARQNWVSVGWHPPRF